MANIEAPPQGTNAVSRSLKRIRMRDKIRKPIKGLFPSTTTTTITETQPFTSVSQLSKSTLFLYCTANNPDSFQNLL